LLKKKRPINEGVTMFTNQTNIVAEIMLVEISTNAKIARAELTLTPASVIEIVGIAVINRIEIGFSITKSIKEI
jgi:hypothetical protein